MELIDGFLLINLNANVGLLIHRIFMVVLLKSTSCELIRNMLNSTAFY